jgi:proteasome lid subunit RPN8/RPN11
MLKISKADYDLIRWEAERSYPHECRGIILGKLLDGERVVTMTLTCKNTRHGTAKDQHAIHPDHVIAAVRLARNRQESVIGFYHSHPDHPSPSTDLAEAHWFGCSYVITSVERGHAAVTDSYILTGAEKQKKFLREEIEIMENAQPVRVAL